MKVQTKANRTNTEWASVLPLMGRLDIEAVEPKRKPARPTNAMHMHFLPQLGWQLGYLTGAMTSGPRWAAFRASRMLIVRELRQWRDLLRAGELAQISQAIRMGVEDGMKDACLFCARG